ncbi:AAA family ATPase [Nocardioides okcheonensis]|uniref:AAA family ATPase n=1 Tax=Nocardioides okcheonensis TaxID=2894081 RepID=UPI001E3D6D1D|nr:AAA family ATPase [Nocardioides okcheonensis]UFN45703.1 AAA family ATPase [Nocardioides okcheonensis]
MDERLIDSLAAAVRAAPDDLTLRLHLAGLLVDAGRGPEAVAHVATVLAADPGSTEALALMGRAMGTPAPPAPASGPAGDVGDVGDVGEGRPQPTDRQPFDWHAAESDVGASVGPMFVDGTTEDPGPAAYDVERAGVRLADVGGLTEVKKRLEAGFLAPLRNPELRTLYGKSMRGGLLLYGPPGCGKTFLAKAVAGELGAAFLHVSLADVLDMYIGQSERNVKELFEVARSSAPCVLFLDELDAIGGKRSLNRSSGARTTVNQLLTELDGVGSDNEGVFVLAATNHPWDVDPALRRPGRLDRTLLVLPPDRDAREAVLRTHLRDRPVERIDTRRLAKATAGFSGADLAHLCESASENALMDSVETGQVRMIQMADFDAALAEVRPSIGPWMETARNVALYANASGEYDDLAKWLRKQR